MRFRGRTTPPPYLNRRDQLRMMGLVLALGLVVLGIRLAGDPAFWAGVFPNRAADDSGEAGEPAGELPPAAPRREALTVVPPDSAAPEDAAVPDDSNVGDPAARFAFDPRPPREWFEPVRDHTFGVLRDEELAHYGSLALARHATLDELEAASEETPSRTNLMHFPDRYRGRLVTIEGTLARLVPIRVGGGLPAKYGYDRMWEAWIATPDAPLHPIRVRLTSPAEPRKDGRTIPQGLSIDEPMRVRVTGYFLKVQAFDAGRDPSRTPLVLGKQLRWFPRATVAEDARGLTRYVVVFASVVALSLAALLVWYHRSDRRFRDAHVRHFTEAPEGAIESLAGIETVDTAEAMRRLAEADRDG